LGIRRASTLFAAVGAALALTLANPPAGSHVEAGGTLTFAVVNPRAAQEMLDEIAAATGGAVVPSVFDADGASGGDICFVAYWQRYQSGDMAAVDRLDPNDNNIPCDGTLSPGEITPMDYAGVGYAEVGRESNAAANGAIVLVFGSFPSPAPVTFEADFGNMYAGVPLAVAGSDYTCDTEDLDCGGFGAMRDGIVAVQIAGPFGAETAATLTVDDGTNQLQAVLNVVADPERDGIPTSYEQSSACLDETSDDALLDADADALANVSEYAEATQPCLGDTDADGCADGEEWTALNNIAGGRRNALNAADFYDVNGTGKVDSIDIALVRSKFNGLGPTPQEDLVYDRRNGAAAWAPGPANNVINALDISLVRASFNHSCLSAP
jgi:hypothetical protein